jgi:hypothetical protein
VARLADGGAPQFAVEAAETLEKPGRGRRQVM